MFHSVINFLKNQKGTITIETLIVLPLFVTLTLCMVNIINIYRVQINLQSLNSEVVREISANWALNSLWKGKSRNKIDALLRNHYGQLFIQKVMPIQPLIRRYVDKPLQARYINAKFTQIPTSSQRIISMKFSYRYQIILPFVNRTIYLHTYASERVWGD